MRKPPRIPVLPILALALLLAAWPAAAGTEKAAETASEAAAAFESFKKLAGKWEGTTEKGDPVSMSYSLVAEGTAVLEMLDIASEHPHSMATVYHLDGDELMLTHYCATGNQPRMRAEEMADGEVSFEFVDATGLASPTAGHMHRAKFHFEGEDRMSTGWTWRENGNDAFEVVLDVHRVAE